MKKVVLLMMMIGVVAFGAVKTELKQGADGKYSGSATLQIVARGRVVKPVSTKMLVIGSGESDSLEFSHSGIKEGESRVNKEKVVAQILERDTQGQYVISKDKKNITAKLVDKETRVETSKNEKEIKSLDGKNIAKVCYDLKSNDVKNGYVGEVSSKVTANKESKGVFLDNSTAVAILVK